MIVGHHKSFKKQYKKLSTKVQLRIDECLLLFEANPFNRELKNHALQGEWLGYRSIYIAGDMRAHYLEVGDDRALFIAVGTHSQLYQ